MHQASTPLANLANQTPNSHAVSHEQLIEVSAKAIVKQHLDKLGIPQDIQIDDAESEEKNSASLSY